MFIISMNSYVWPTFVLANAIASPLNLSLHSCCGCGVWVLTISKLSQC